MTTKTVVTSFAPPETVTEPGSVRRHSWPEFRDAGFLWLVNRALHLYGWSIVLSFDDDSGDFLGAYPVRCDWRGFPKESDERGFLRIAEWMKRAGATLAAEAKRD